MSWLDLILVALFFVGMFAVAFALRRSSTRNIESYFLGNRQMHWWLLGASGMASNVDMAGTMLISSLLFAFGLKGFFIELRGGIVLIMAFYLVCLGKWTRRSGKMTVAEWMEFRFGKGIQGDLPRLLTAVFNIVFFVWAMAYFTLAATKFFDALLPTVRFNLGPWALTCDGTVYSAGLIVIVMLYTALAGFAGVVWTDVLQGGLILFLAVFIAVKAYLVVDPATFPQRVGPGWLDLSLPWKIDAPEDYATFRFFAVGISFYLLKSIVDGLSGAGGYLAQRYFAARNERDCGLLSLFWIVLMTFRWPMMMGIAVLGLHAGRDLRDPELVLPTVLREMVGPGIRGLLLVTLLGAAMSTYSSFMNAGSSYFVKDIYERHLRPRAGQRELVTVGHVATMVLVLLGILLALRYRQINELWGWLNMGLGAGLILPNFLRWYWWRLNGYGFAAGAAAGMVTAFLQVRMLSHWSDCATFSFIAGTALAAMIGVSLLTPPADLATLREFFRTTRPFGLWGPVRRMLEPGEVQAIRAENRADLVALLFAVPFQLALFLLPMLVVVHLWIHAAALGVLLVILSSGLYWFWFRRLAAAR